MIPNRNASAWLEADFPMARGVPTRGPVLQSILHDHPLGKPVHLSVWQRLCLAYPLPGRP